MKHELTGTAKGKMGIGCTCGKRFPVESAAKKHVTEENAKLAETDDTPAQYKDTEKTIQEQAQAGADEINAKAAAQSNSGDAGKNDATPVATPPKEHTDKSTGEITESPTGLAKTPEPPAASNSTGSMPLELDHMTLNQINFIGQTMAKSGMFPDVQDASKALVKILAGQEIGVTPFQAMTNIHIIKGKATLSANLMAAKVKGSGKYDYRVVKQTPEECSIDFFEIVGNKREPIGNSSFTLAEARTAGTQNLDKFARNMLFARAMSNGTKWYTPDVFNGNLVYLPEELGAKTDGDGEVIQ